MKTFKVCCLSALISSTAIAETDLSQMNIRQGNFTTAAYLNVSTVSQPGLPSVFELTASPATEYFLLDRLALGANFLFSYTSNSPADIAAGPVLDYFFFTHGQLATFLGATVIQH